MKLALASLNEIHESVNVHCSCGTVDGFKGPARNPWRYDFSNPPDQGQSSEEKESDWFIAGGSSGGSAVAVATGSALV